MFYTALIQGASKIHHDLQLLLQPGKTPRNATNAHAIASYDNLKKPSSETTLAEVAASLGCHGKAETIEEIEETIRGGARESGRDRLGTFHLR